MPKGALRRAFPTMSCSWIDVQIAFEQKPIIEIGSRIPRDGFKAAVLHKLFPTLYPHTTKYKAAAARAIHEATRRRRPTTCIDREITAVMDAVLKSPSDIAEIVDHTRGAHYRRPLTSAEHFELGQRAQVCRSRTDWRAVLTPWLKCP